MHDGIELETRGIPAAVLCTDRFEVTGRAMAEARGAPDFPIALVRHPIASLRPAEVAAQADAILARVIAILTGGAG